MQKGMFIQLLLISVLFGFCLSTTCKDGSHCPGCYTCCLTPRGVGCCPLENANCCGDGIHCCPQGYFCNEQGRCSESSNFNAVLTFLLSEETINAEKLIFHVENSDEKKLNSISDLIKCINDLRPVVGDVVEIVNDYRKGDPESKEKAKEALIKLIADAYNAETDCAKLKTLIEQDLLVN